MNIAGNGCNWVYGSIGIVNAKQLRKMIAANVRNHRKKVKGYVFK